MGLTGTAKDVAPGVAEEGVMPMSTDKTSYAKAGLPFSLTCRACSSMVSLSLSHTEACGGCNHTGSYEHV